MSGSPMTLSRMTTLERRVAKSYPELFFGSVALSRVACLARWNDVADVVRTTTRERDAMVLLGFVGGAAVAALSTERRHERDPLLGGVIALARKFAGTVTMLGRALPIFVRVQPLTGLCSRLLHATLALCTANRASVFDVSLPPRLLVGMSTSWIGGAACSLVLRRRRGHAPSFYGLYREAYRP